MIARLLNSVRLMNNKINTKFKSFFSINKDNKVVILSLAITFLVCFVSYSAYIVNGFVLL